MAYSPEKRICESLPGWLKRPASWVPFGFLAGRPCRRTLRRGAWIDRASREEFLACQEGALREVLEFAVGKVWARRQATKPCLFGDCGWQSCYS